jgi:cold shock CspA family protein
VLVTFVVAVLTAGTVLVPTASAQKDNGPGIVNSVSELYVTDLDADGAPDVLVASPQNSEIAWYQNGKPKGKFSNRTVISGNVRLLKSVMASDLDADGDIDVVSASSLDNKVAWYENTDGYGTFSDQKVLASDAGSPYSAYADNLDGDDDRDVTYASNGSGNIGWVKNNGSSFEDPSTISSNVAGARSVHAADLDSDGDQDILSASSSFGGTNKIAWYRNTVGGFASQNIISQKVKGARSVIGVDLDQDDDYDVVSASSGDGKIAWYDNTDGYGTFSEQKVISDQLSGAQTVSAADVDGDGDLDLVAASNKDGKVVWYENVDGKKTFSSAKVITKKENYKAAFVADIDVDGDPDVAFISESKSRIAWCSNQIEQGKGWTSQRIIGPKN